MSDSEKTRELTTVDEKQLCDPGAGDPLEGFVLGMIRRDGEPVPPAEWQVLPGWNITTP